MLTNLELYGTNDVPPVPKDVCNVRIDLLKEKLLEEGKVHYMNQDNNKLNTLIKGIDFWTKLRDGEETY